MKNDRFTVSIADWAKTNLTIARRREVEALVKAMPMADTQDDVLYMAVLRGLDALTGSYPSKNNANTGEHA